MDDKTPGRVLDETGGKPVSPTVMFFGKCNRHSQHGQMHKGAGNFKKHLLNRSYNT
jgi:hypothetical protein